MIDKFLSPDAIVEQINSGTEYFLFSYDYTFAGFAAILEKDDELFLSKLYVDEEFRGKGIGKYMFQKFVEICKLRNLKKTFLQRSRNIQGPLSQSQRGSAIPKEIQSARNSRAANATVTAIFK